MEPTYKNPEIDALLTSITGVDRKEEIVKMNCVWCKKNIHSPQDFRNEKSLREYMSSWMCQECQDALFGPD